MFSLGMTGIDFPRRARHILIFRMSSRGNVAKSPRVSFTESDDVQISGIVQPSFDCFFACAMVLVPALGFDSHEFRQVVGPRDAYIDELGRNGRV